MGANSNAVETDVLRAIGGDPSNNIAIRPLHSIPSVPRGGFLGSLAKSSTVGELREELSQKLDVPLNTLSLAYQGRDLEDKLTLRDNGIVEPGAAARRSGARIELVFLLRGDVLPGAARRALDQARRTAAERAERERVEREALEARRRSEAATLEAVKSRAARAAAAANRAEEDLAGRLGGPLAPIAEVPALRPDQLAAVGPAAALPFVVPAEPAAAGPARPPAPVAVVGPARPPALAGVAFAVPAAFGGARVAEAAADAAAAAFADPAAAAARELPLVHGHAAPAAAAAGRAGPAGGGDACTLRFLPVGVAAVGHEDPALLVQTRLSVQVSEVIRQLHETLRAGTGDELFLVHGGHVLNGRETLREAGIIDGAELEYYFAVAGSQAPAGR